MPSLLHLSDAHQPLADAVAANLAQVEVIFERQLASEFPAVNQLCRHIEKYRGKMLRPTLVVVSGMAVGGVESVDSAHQTVAAVAEMIHMATLVHDDVLDEAQMRRRGSTVNHLHGNETAVMLGDFLISNAFHLCSTMGRPEINLSLGKVTNTLCEGELIQLHHRDDLSLDEPTYFEIVRRKTASLVGECCRLGAVLSGAVGEGSRALCDYGLNLGIAFQIQDDLLDLAGTPDVVGKSLGRDLDKGKLTLPLIVHLASASPEDRGRAIRMIKQREALPLLDALRTSGSLDAARWKATELVAAAKAQLDLIPQGPGRELLDRMADAVIAREF